MNGTGNIGNVLENNHNLRLLDRSEFLVDLRSRFYAFSGKGGATQLYRAYSCPLVNEN